MFRDPTKHEANGDKLGKLLQTHTAGLTQIYNTKTLLTGIKDQLKNTSSVLNKI